MQSRRDGSVPQQGQHDFKCDQQDDGDFECFHPLAAGLLDEEVVDVADGLELAADALLPAAEVEPGTGDLEDAGKVMVADQFQGVVDPLEEARRLDLELADLADGVAVEAPERGDVAPALLGPDQAVGGLEPVVEPVVDVAEFQELDVGEFDDLQGVGALGVGDDARRPVEDDEVVGRV